MKAILATAILLIFPVQRAICDEPEGINPEKLPRSEKLEPGNSRTSKTNNDHGGKTTNTMLRLSDEIAQIERIVSNSDGSVRGRVITFYAKDGRPFMSIAYRGFNEPWFKEFWKWGAGPSYTAERRTFEGKLIFTETFPDDPDDQVKTEDPDGKPLSQEDEKKLSDEIADLLF